MRCANVSATQFDPRTPALIGHTGMPRLSRLALVAVIALGLAGAGAAPAFAQVSTAIGTQPIPAVSAG